MKKRIFAVCLMLSMFFSITACGDASENTNNQNDINSEDSGKDALETSGEVMNEDEGDLIFDVPEGFAYDEATTLYSSQDGLANINYVAKDNDGSFPMMTQMLVEMGVESSLSAQLDTEVDITIVNWEETEVDGYEALRYSITYTVGEIYIEQTQIVVNGAKKVHSLTFTEMANVDYADEFTACEESLRFE